MSKEDDVPYRMLAFDHDETLAMGGALHPRAAEALAAAKDAGWLLALVTGRTHARIVEICPCVDLFDLVVDENGAVLYFPATGAVEELADRPDARLREGLQARGVPFMPGRIVTITKRRYEAQVRDVIGAGGLALDLYCNRFAVMIVPRGTSKETGLRTGLERLGVAPGDVIAFGDDENDFALFEVAGLCVAVGNAIDAVKDAADIVLDRPNGEGVAAFIHGTLLESAESLPEPRR
jgi:hydroxymethylpyrimidine pyrophosphatase-like HAD family hydrolase